MHYCRRQIRYVVLLLLLTAAAQAFAAKPFCALRDPAHEIYEMFPDATSYKSDVRDINLAVRQSVADRLPFTLHLRELGRHTLYVPMSDERELGIVHARSEASEWGLVEIVWSLDPDLAIRDFRFQRCRGSSCRTLAGDAFRDQLRGRRVTDLVTMLSDDYQSLSGEIVGIGTRDEPLATAVIRSAMKTITVTDILRNQASPIVLTD